MLLFTYFIIIIIAVLALFVHWELKCTYSCKLWHDCQKRGSVHRWPPLLLCRLCISEFPCSLDKECPTALLNALTIVLRLFLGNQSNGSKLSQSSRLLSDLSLTNIIGTLSWLLVSVVRLQPSPLLSQGSSRKVASPTLSSSLSMALSPSLGPTTG